MITDSKLPAPHAEDHSDGGDDEITVENLATAGAVNLVPVSDGAGGLSMAAPVPAAHAASHENGGADEINVDGLSGELADAQIPLPHTHSHASTTGQTADDHHAQSHAHDGVDGSGTVAHSATTGQGVNDHHAQDHASRHSDGGADEITVENLATSGASNTAPISDGAGGLDMKLVVLNSAFNNKGDLLSASANDTPLILPVGTDGQVLESRATEPAGLRWVDSPETRVTDQYIRLNADSTGPSEVDVGRLKAFELPNGSTKGVDGSFTIPTGATLTADPQITFNFSVSNPGSGNANIRLQLAAAYVAVGELVTKVADETILATVAVVDVADEQHQTTMALDRTLIAASDLVIFNLSRIGGVDPPDTYEGAVAFVHDTAVLLEFTV